MTAPDAYFDSLETRAPETRAREQAAALAAQVAHARRLAPAYAELLADVDAAEVTDRAALAKLPVVRKSDLIFSVGFHPTETFEPKNFNPGGKIPVLHLSSQSLPAAHRIKGMDPKLAAALKAALLKLQDEKALSGLRISGFLDVDDSEYDFVRKAMKQAQRFERR